MEEKTLYFTFSSPNRIRGFSRLAGQTLQAIRKHSLAYRLCASTLQLLLDFHILPNENFYHLPQETNDELIFYSKPEQKTVGVQKVTR